jgi:drug/metabolite transporter (DMT)-like permease
MTRLQADFALGLAGLIWGFGFVAQKVALDSVGPFTFVAARFLISALAVLPLVLYEKNTGKLKNTLKEKNLARKIAPVCLVITIGVIVQQYGLTMTDVTDTAFINGLYVVLTPFAAAMLYGHKLSMRIMVAAVLSFLGVWILSGGAESGFKINLNGGNGLILIAAFCFALWVAMMGKLTMLMRAPFFLSFLQYAATGIAALVLALMYEKLELTTLLHALLPILYAGLVSGGIGYTLQVIAQQHTPPADTAIILNLEALFGGVFGVLIMKDKLTIAGAIGCLIIIAAIVLVETGPLMQWRQKRRLKKSAAA